MFLGICDAILFNNLYDILSNFPKEYLIYKNTGQGLSGISINIIRFFTIFVFSNLNIEEKTRRFYELVIFYSISAVFSILAIILVFVKNFFKFIKIKK